MEPIDYAGALRRSWRLIVLLAVVAAIVAVLIPVSHPKRVKSAYPYAANALVGAPPTATGSPLRGGVSSNQILYFANKALTKETVASDAGVSTGAMSASVVPAAGVNTAGASAILKRNAPTVIELTGYGATPAEAISVASTYADDLAQVVQDGLDASPKTSGVTSGYSVLQPAVTASSTRGGGKSSLGASRKVRGLAGLAIGALVAAGIVLLRELLDKRLRGGVRAEANFGFPVIAEIPLVVPLNQALDAGRVTLVDVVREPESPGAEAYRMLRMSVMFEGLASLTGPTDPFALGFNSMGDGAAEAMPAGGTNGSRTLVDRKVVLVTSAGSEPTRPHVAANLAAVYAEAGQRVVVISTGDIGPRHDRSTNGQSNEEIRAEDVAERLEPSRLEYVSRLNLEHFVTTSGQLANRAPAIFDAVRSLCDLVIVEVPPLLAVHHAEALAHSVDMVLVVAECNFTTFDDARQAGDQLRRMGAPVMGIVLTNVRIPRSDVRHLGLPRTVVGVADPEPEGEHLEAIGASVGSTTGPTDESPN